jgi:pimeloyl-ACP methyl ester carboxylesterase
LNHLYHRALSLPRLILFCLLFLSFLGTLPSQEQLPPAEDVIMQQWMERWKERLHRFGYFQYKDEAWVDFEGGVGSRAVVLLHGLDEIGTIWDDLAPVLNQEGHVVLKFCYPNDQAISDSAHLFREQLQWLRSKGVEDVAIVCHSMGGLIARDALTRPSAYDGPLPDIQRLITVGTPNHGAPMARLRTLAEWREQLVRLAKGESDSMDSVFDGSGEAAQDLLPDSEYLQELNARPLPSVPITIIAGRMDHQVASNDESDKEPSVLGKVWGDVVDKWKSFTEDVGDGVVPLSSTKLEGVDDIQVVKGNHRGIVKNVFSSSEIPPAVIIVKDRLAKWK